MFDWCGRLLTCEPPEGVLVYEGHAVLCFRPAPRQAFRRVALWCGLSHTDAEWESVFTQLCAANGWPPDLGPDSIQLRGFLMVDMGTSSLHALRQRIQEDLREQVPEVILGA